MQIITRQSSIVENTSEFFLFFFCISLVQLMSVNLLTLPSLKSWLSLIVFSLHTMMLWLMSRATASSRLLADAFDVPPLALRMAALW